MTVKAKAGGGHVGGHKGQGNRGNVSYRKNSASAVFDFSKKQGPVNSSRRSSSKVDKSFKLNANRSAKSATDKSIGKVGQRVVQQVTVKSGGESRKAPAQAGRQAGFTAKQVQQMIASTLKQAREGTISKDVFDSRMAQFNQQMQLVAQQSGGAGSQTGGAGSQAVMHSHSWPAGGHRLEPLYVDSLKNAGLTEAEIKDAVLQANKEGRAVIASKPKEDKKKGGEEEGNDAKGKKTADARFAEIGYNINRGIGFFADPRSFMGILLTLILIFFALIVILRLFPLA